MSADQRRRLAIANHRVAELSVDAAKVLSMSLPKKRQG
jgi:hypothetical protein